MAKITKREMFAMVREIVIANGGENTELLTNFIDHEVELLTKKNTGEKKPTAKQTANESVKADIVDFMEANKMYTISELLKGVPALDGCSNQYASSLVRQLVASGVLVRTEDKRKAYFSLA